MTDRDERAKALARLFTGETRELILSLAVDAAEVEQLRQEIVVPTGKPNVWCDTMGGSPAGCGDECVCRQLVEARADAETLRQENERLRLERREAVGLALWVAAIESQPIETRAEWALEMLGRYRVVRVQRRAALAAAQEPPAECKHANWRLEFRSPDRRQISPDPTTYGQWIVCLDCGHERRAQEPPAKGDDR